MLSMNGIVNKKVTTKIKSQQPTAHYSLSKIAVVFIRWLKKYHHILRTGVTCGIAHPLALGSYYQLPPRVRNSEDGRLWRLWRSARRY